MNNTIKIVLGVVATVALLGFGYAKASESFWSRSAEAFGKALAARVELPGELTVTATQSGEPIQIGAAGDTFGVPLIAANTITTSTGNNSSTTLGSHLNPSYANGGRRRLVTGVRTAIRGTATTYLGAGLPLILDFGTTTLNGYSSSSVPIMSTAFTTTTEIAVVQANFTSTTPSVNNRWRQIWNPGEYFFCQLNRVVSSTDGLGCLIEFINIE